MIKIKQTKNADTRTAISKITQDGLLEQSMTHIQAVKEVMSCCADLIRAAGERHGYTKVYDTKGFFNAVEKVQNDPSVIFELEPWGVKHYNEERHHLNRVVPDDVNLFDVIEMVVDNVTAGLARSGEVRGEIIKDPSMLVRAVDNTVKLLASKCEVEK